MSAPAELARSRDELRDAVSTPELPKDQQWRWQGRDRRVSVRITTGLWAEIEERAAALNLPFSAILRDCLNRGLAAHLICQGLKQTDTDR
jgi:predicted DNA binding CopG/RHH family protein